MSTQLPGTSVSGNLANACRPAILVRSCHPQGLPLEDSTAHEYRAWSDT